MNSKLIIIGLLLTACSQPPTPLTKGQFEAILKDCREKGRVIGYGYNLRGQIVEAHCDMTVQEYDQQPATVQDAK